MRNPATGPGSRRERVRDVSFTSTLLLLVAGLALSGWAGWQERRQRGLGELPLLPPIPVLLIGVLIVLVSLAHLVTLSTGVPLKSRFLPHIGF
jgi:hypothetical protein